MPRDRDIGRKGGGFLHDGGGFLRPASALPMDRGVDRKLAVEDEEEEEDGRLFKVSSKGQAGK